jgi:hypothetical protein
MSQLITPIMGPGVGITPGNGSVTVRNVTAVPMRAGEVVMLDLAQADSDTVSVIPGHANATTGAADSVFGCVILPSSVAATRTGQFLILLEAIAAGATGKAALTGQVPALLQLGVTNFALGAPLGVFTVSGTSGNGGLCPLSAIASNGTVGEKIVAYLMHTATIASSAATNTAMGTVWFNGLGAGFGQNAG